MAPSSRRLVERIRTLAGSSSTVLIRGENGVGKELVATLLHELGPRREEPLVWVDCASLPPEFVERQLFGGPEEAQLRVGQMEIVGVGTLVLEEVAALSMNTQAKLLQAIEKKEFHALGSGIPRKLSARVLLSSSVDLERAVARRMFREDLYYRLCVGALVIPPLRERSDDIPALAELFVAQFAQLHRRAQPSLSGEALDSLRNYAFPGNVRELRDAMEQAALHSPGPRIGMEDLPPAMHRGRTHPLISLDELERGHIAEVLAATQGRKSKAAEILGISRKTLLEKRKRYGLE